MLAADMKLPERILRDTRETQHRLVKRRVFAFRLRFESVGADGVTGGTETRDDLLTRDVHLLTLDDDFFSRSGAGRGRGRGDGAWRGCGSFLRHYNTRPEKQHTCCG